MSLMNILKSSVPNIDPSWTPADISADSLKELFILQRAEVYLLGSFS